MPNWSAKVTSWGDVQRDFGDRGDEVKCEEREALHRDVEMSCWGHGGAKTGYWTRRVMRSCVRSELNWPGSWCG